ncbi:MAG: hypothetical protein M1814_002433 [Vezdaea aestivalis]|nr:MAG: hypothetical protein M1814_002433 [Vezdaea aestivalis]
MGQMKCTDKDRNVILGYTYEYRHPTSSQVANAAEDSSSSKVKLDMTSRYLGLVVVPGEHIVKMELEKSAKGKAGASGEA